MPRVGPTDDDTTHQRAVATVESELPGAIAAGWNIVPQPKGAKTSEFPGRVLYT